MRTYFIDENALRQKGVSEDVIRGMRSQTELVTRQERIIRGFYTVVIRTLFILKFLARAGAVAATWYFIGHWQAYALAGVIAFIVVLQTTIHKLQHILHPDLRVSEWYID